MSGTLVGQLEGEGSAGDTEHPHIIPSAQQPQKSDFFLIGWLMAPRLSVLANMVERCMSCYNLAATYYNMVVISHVVAIPSCSICLKQT